MVVQRLLNSEALYPTRPAMIFEERPETIRAHLARARAAKLTGVNEIAGCGFPIQDAQTISREADLAGLPKAGEMSSRWLT